MLQQDYSKKDDWKIITNVKSEFIRRWINTDKLKLNCTRGTVDIEGELDFVGQGKAGMDSITTIQNALKKIDASLGGLSGVRAVKWKLVGWERKGKYWNYQPTLAIRKINEAKGLK